MKFGSAIVAAATLGAASAQQSICDKYTTALLKQNTPANQYTLLTLLVNTAAIGNFTGPGTKNPSLPGSMMAVPGILASDGPLLKYFDGSLLSTNNNGMPSSVNFLDGGSAPYIIANPTKGGMVGSNQYMLLTHLYQFFGVLLGCTGYGMDGFPSYAGEASMYSVHKYMDISNSEFMYFVNQVGYAALSFGASKADAMAAGTALTKAFGYRCQPAETIVKAQGAQLQAICIASDCPEAPSATCGAYAPATEPAMASGTMMASMASGTVGALTDGQPTATMLASSSMAVGALTDHQPTATALATSMAVGALTDHQPTATALASFTGAAVMPTAAPVAIAAIAGLAALAL